MEDPVEICHSLLRKEYKTIQKSVNTSVSSNARKMRDIVVIQGNSFWSQFNQQPTYSYDIQGTISTRFDLI